jgi:radical SAM superfamily enzyme YgiQ (UPF0313 family)
MKCLLIHPPITDNRKWDLAPCFPHGLGYVAGALRKAEIEVYILDIFINKMSKDEVISILQEKLLYFDWVGISGIINGYKYIRWLTAEIKKLAPNIPVVLGGSICSPNPRLLLESIDADICCIGEGEETVVDITGIISGRVKPKNVPGIAYKKEGSVYINSTRPFQENLEQYDFPYWEAFDMEKYITSYTISPISRGKRKMNIIGSRGCPYNCHFCSPNFGRKIRVRPVKSVIDELSILVERYGVEHFEFSDELFFLNEEFTVEFCEKLITADLNLTYRALGRANIFDKFSLDTFLLMKKSGCVWIAFGMESGSQKMLDLMNKNVKLEQIERVIRKIRKCGIKFSGNFILGYPGETRETLKETIEFCKKNVIPPPKFTFACPLPGSALYDDCIKKGLIKDEIEYWEKIDGTLWDLVINLTEFSDEELYRLREGTVSEIREWTSRYGIRSFKD